MGFSLKLKFTDILVPGSLKNNAIHGKLSGYQFDVRLGYYRGHYLSDIETLEVRLDNQPVPEESITFCLNGKTFLPGELKYMISEFWYILAPATLMIHQPGGLAAGDHEVDLTLMLRSPYMPVPGSREAHAYVPIDSCDRQIMTLADEVIHL